MREQWVSDNLQAFTECAFIGLGYGREDDYRRRYGLYIETQTIEGAIALTGCRTLELADVGREVLRGDDGAAAFIKDMLPAAGNNMPGIICFEHHRPPGTGPSITGVRPIGVPPRLPDSEDVPVPGWEHLLFRLVGDPHGFRKNVKSLPMITASVRVRISESYARIVAAQSARDPKSFRMDPVALARLAAKGDIASLTALKAHIYSEADRAELNRALSQAAPVAAATVSDSPATGASK